VPFIPALQGSSAGRYLRPLPVDRRGRRRP
jgi:hypothetical protein